MNYPKYEQINYNSDIPAVFHFDSLHGEKGEHYDIYSHWHAAVEILYFKRGCAEVFSNTQSVIAEPEDIIIINSNSIHRINCMGDHAKYYCLIVDKAFLEKNGFPISDREFQTKIRNEKIAELIKSFSKAYHPRIAYQKQKLKGYLYLILSELYENHSYETHIVNPVSSNDKIEICKRAITYIQDNYHCPITVDNIASHCHISKFYFCRMFKEVTGITVVNFINSFRCLRAKELLVSSELSVSEISELCGFESPSYFTKIFKKIYNTTPTLFKKQ